MVFFKNLNIFLFQIFFMKSLELQLELYKDTEINLNEKKTFEIALNKFKNDILIVLNFNCNVSSDISNSSIKLIYEIDKDDHVPLSNKNITKPIEHFFKINENIAYLIFKMEGILKKNIYKIEFIPSGNSKKVKFFVYDNQNNYSLFGSDIKKSFSRDFDIIFNQNFSLNFNWTVKNQNYLRTNWTSNSNNNLSLSLNNNIITGINAYNINKFEKYKIVVITFNVPANCDITKLRLNFDINSTNIYDLKEINLNKTDYIYFENFYFYMYILNYDSDLTNYLKFTKKESDNFEYKYLISNADSENAMITEIENETNFNNFINFTNNIQGYKIDSKKFKYIIIKVTNLNKNTFFNEIGTLNIFKENEIFPSINNNTEYNLKNLEIYKIILDISSTNKNLFYINDYNIHLDMMKRNFKDLNTYLFYIDKETTNSTPYFNITLFNNISVNKIQIYNDNNESNIYSYNYNEQNKISFKGNIPSNQNLYFINIYDVISNEKILYTTDYNNVDINYKFGYDNLNLSDFISCNYEKLNYPLIADKKFDLLSLKCKNSNLDCSYSILYKPLYENNTSLTIKYNETYEFLISENEILNISINNSQSLINSNFLAELLENSVNTSLNVFISMDGKTNVTLNKDNLIMNSTRIIDGNFLYFLSENGSAFISLKFSLPINYTNNFDSIAEKFNSQYYLFEIPNLEKNEFINLIIFSETEETVNILYEETNDIYFSRDPNNSKEGKKIMFNIRDSFPFKYYYIKIDNKSDYFFHYKKMSFNNLEDFKNITESISKFLIYEYKDEHDINKNGTLEFSFLKGFNILHLYLYENLNNIQQTSDGFINHDKNSSDSFELDKTNKTYYIVLYLKNEVDDNELEFYVFNQGKIYSLMNITYIFNFKLDKNKSKTLTFNCELNYNYSMTKIIEKNSMNNELIFFNDSSSTSNVNLVLKNNSENYKYYNYSKFMTFKITNNNTDINIDIVDLSIDFHFLNIGYINEDGFNQILNSNIFIINNSKTKEGTTKITTFSNLDNIEYIELDNNDKEFAIDKFKTQSKTVNDIYFKFQESIKYYLFKNNQIENINYSYYELKNSIGNLSINNIYELNSEEDYVIYNFDNQIINNTLNILFDENIIESQNLSILVYDSYDSIRKSDFKNFSEGQEYNLKHILEENKLYSIVFIKNNLSSNQTFFLNTNDSINLTLNEYKYTYSITYFTDEFITFHYSLENEEKYKYFHYQFGNFLNDTTILCQINQNTSTEYFNTFNIESLNNINIDFSIKRSKYDNNELPFIFKFNNIPEPDSNLHLLNLEFSYENDILTNRAIEFNQNLKSYYNKDKIAFKTSNKELKIGCSYKFNSNDNYVNNDFEDCLFYNDSSDSLESYYYFYNKISDDKKSEKDNAIIKIDIINENMTVNTKEFKMFYKKIIFDLNSNIEVYLDKNEVKTYNISNMTNDKFVILRTEKENYLTYQLFNNGSNFIELFGETKNLFEFIDKSFKYFNYFDYTINLTSTFLDISNVNSTKISNYLFFLNQEKRYILYMDLIFGTPDIIYCHNFSSISFIVNHIECNKKLDSYFLIDKNSEQTLVQVNSTINNSFTYLNIIDIIDNNDNFNLSFTLGEIYYIVIQNKKAVINFINSNNYNINELKKNNLKIGLFSANKQNFNYNDAYSDNKVIITDFDFNDNSFKFNVSCPDNNFLLIVKVGLVSSNYTKIDSSKKDEIKDVLTVFELPYDSENNSCKLTLTNKGDNECINIIYQLTDKQIYSLPHNISKCINLLENEEIEISIEDPLKKPKNTDKNNFNYNRKLDKNETSFYIILQTNKTNSKILYNFYIYDKKDNNFKKYFPVLIVVVVSIITVVFIIICIIHRNYKKKKILIFKDFFEGNKKKKRDKDLVLKSFDLNSILPTKKNEDIDISLEKESFDNMDKSIDSIN